MAAPTSTIDLDCARGSGIPVEQRRPDEVARYFGFVVGGALDGATAADVLTTAWDQPALNAVTSPAAALVEEVGRRLAEGAAGALHPVATDAQGAIDVADLARVLAGGPGGPTIVSLQAGNVGSGAFDDLTVATATAHDHGAWVHVDGAFGLWAATSPTARHLVTGMAAADSWATDGHKWLNVPYDSGYAFCAHPRAHTAAAGPGLVS